MPKLHIIIGEQDARKSSLLKCLTGVGTVAFGNAKTFSVKTATGPIIKVFCRVSALQEGNHPLHPADFVSHVLNLSKVPTDVAITLRVDATLNDGVLYPRALDYLKVFAATPGWSISNIALMGPSACAIVGLPRRPTTVSVPKSMTQPTNESAAAVRAAWGWL